MRGISTVSGVVMLALGLNPIVASADEISNGYNVGGEIQREWIAVGRNGFAVTPENNALNAGKWQAFSNHNSIYWQRDSGAHQVGGYIRDRWEQLGWENGVLGYPLTRELDARKPGKLNRFQGGNIYWKSGATQAYNVQGLILQKWSTLDYENGPLGFPVGNEVKLNKNGGATSLFEGGSIYWSAATGAHVVWGAIRDNWASRNFENGRYGYPTSDEYNAAGGKAQNFQGGTIDWRPGDPVRPSDIASPSLPRGVANYAIPGGTDPRARAQTQSEEQAGPSETAGATPTDDPSSETPTSSVGEGPSMTAIPPTSDSGSTLQSASPSTETFSDGASESDSNSVPSTEEPQLEDGPSQAATSSPDSQGAAQRAASSQDPGETDPDGDPLPDNGCKVAVAFPHASKTPGQGGALAYPRQIHTQVKSTCQYGPPIAHDLETYTAILRWWGRPENLAQIPLRGKTLRPSGEVAYKNQAGASTIKINSAVKCEAETYFRYRTVATGSYTFPDGTTDTKTTYQENDPGNEVRCLS